LSELARDLQAERDQDAVLRRIVAATLAEIPSAVAVGITTVERGHFRTAAQTDSFVSEMDQVQYRQNDGPCVRALREEITVRSDDLAAEPRWPKYAAAAMEHGLRSMMSFQLFVERDNLGALNLYADKPNAFDEDDENAGLLLASHAAVAISGKRVEANLRTALESRDVIGQAKGILMERYGVADGPAFRLLVRVSQNTHRPVRDVAAELVRTRRLAALEGG
jgi:GAF domain-containing protein